MYHCELCDEDIKKCKKTQHKKSQNHQYFLRRSLNGDKLERPDQREMYDGMEYFCCLKCKRGRKYFVTGISMYLAKNITQQGKMV